MSIDATEAVRALLEHIGEDPNREGLADTPARVAKSLKELTRGYATDAATILSTTFDNGLGHEPIILVGIPFSSLCEHHMLPFIGTAAVGYIPGERIVGLSKLARLVDCFAKRLQVQERIGHQITAAIMAADFGAIAAGAIIRAQHQCMVCRGIERHGATMITRSFTGDEAKRSDLMQTLDRDDR